MKQTLVIGCVTGPFRNEAEFKKALLQALRKKMPGFRHFSIETSETEPGMPDLLTIGKEGAVLTEVKYVREDGLIRFQKDQPLFYKKHMDFIKIEIVVWDSRDERMYSVSPASVVAERKLSIPCDRSIDDVDAYMWPEE